MLSLIPDDDLQCLNTIIKISNDDMWVGQGTLRQYRFQYRPFLCNDSFISLLPNTTNSCVTCITSNSKFLYFNIFCYSALLGLIGKSQTYIWGEIRLVL